MSCIYEFSLRRQNAVHQTNSSHRPRVQKDWSISLEVLYRCPAGSTVAGHLYSASSAQAWITQLLHCKHTMPAFFRKRTTCRSSLHNPCRPLDRLQYVFNPIPYLVRCSTFGCRSFASAVPTVWNSLPNSLRNPAIGPEQFRRTLKTHLFACC